ncbi:WD domain G-beta repeat uncharacterized protein [Actinocorallia herbida]|uniref:WD domain G-beta repeat uncharacterized protein n=1 Tax=Actinocorallia herbida TaxID=58109 RepID=A0A3N1CYV5_9ACTN|nr:WD domain G-beta repeat uncharacterized protein [Actinocorallia herbida]
MAGRYRMLESIDAGTVWTAHDERVGRHVSLAWLARPRDADPEAWAAAAARAADRIAALRHPGIAAVHALVAEVDGGWTVTDHVTGRTLARTVTEDGVMTLEDAARVGARIADALAVVHAAGLAHGGLTPGRVLLAEQGTVLIGFGGGHTATAVDDLWSLGVLLAFAVSGEPRPTSRTGPLGPLIAALTDPDPARRPPAARIAAALRRYLPPVTASGWAPPAGPSASAVVPVPHVAPAPPPPLTGFVPVPAAPLARPVLRRRLLIGAGALVVVAGGGILASKVLSTAVPIAKGIDTAMIRPRVVMKANGAGVRALAYSPDGSLLAVADENGAIRVWDMPAGILVRTIEDGYAGSLHFGPGAALLSGPAVWDPRTGETLHRFPDVLGSECTTAFSPDGRTIATVDGKGLLVFLDISTGRTSDRVPTGHGGSASAVTYSPDGSVLATCGQDGSASLWDPASGDRLGEPLTGHAGGVTCGAFSPDGRTLATGSADRTVRLWDTATGRSLGDPFVTEWKGVVFDVAFDAEGEKVASVGQEPSVTLWDVHGLLRSTGSPLLGHDGVIMSVAFHPREQIAVAGGLDGSVLLWEL